MRNADSTSLGLVRLRPEHEGALTAFLEALERNGDAGFFHPHGFSGDDAAGVCGYEGADLFFGLFADGTMIAYGLLRGWDEGFAIPSLGVAVAPEYRGAGVGRTLVELLHRAAAARGASHVRLKVEAGNGAARRLYEDVGYRFDGTVENGELVGLLELRHR